MSSQFDIEVGFISKVLEDKDLILVKDKQIKAHYFQDPDCKKVFKFIEKYHFKNGQVPTVRVIKSNFPNLDLDTYKVKGKRIVGTEEPLTYWCDELRLKAKHNRLCDIVESVAGELDGMNTEKAFEEIKKGIIQVEQDLVETNAIDTTKDAEDRKANYLRRKETKGMLGIPTGINKLDLVLKGLQDKQLITLIAKTGVGKTWLWILIACYCQLNDYRVLFFTTEMSEEQIEDRQEAMLVKMMLDHDLNYGRFKSGSLTPEEETAYFDLLDSKHALEQMIIDTATDVTSVSAKIEQYNPDIIFIDSVYLMQDVQGAKEDWLRVAHITRDLKLLAKSTKKPICINSQADSTTSKKTGPELDNIGFSKAIGQDSDVVLGLVRDEEMIEDKEAKIKVLKQREGVLCNIVINWDFNTMNFSEIYGEEFDKEDDEDDTFVHVEEEE